jgi:hypothetical protein
VDDIRLRKRDQLNNLHLYNVDKVHSMSPTSREGCKGRKILAQPLHLSTCLELERLDKGTVDAYGYRLHFGSLVNHCALQDTYSTLNKLVL